MEKDLAQWKKALVDELIRGNLAFYGSDAPRIPELVKAKPSGRVVLFTPNAPGERSPGTNIRLEHCKNLLSIRWEESDLCFLQGPALRVALLGYPLYSKYVLLRLATIVDWVILLLRLVRSSRNQASRYLGEIILSDYVGNTRWAVFQNKHPLEKGVHLSLSTDIGTPGLLSYLRNEQLDYVLLRPLVKSEYAIRHCDKLSLLASDEDVNQIRKFLYSNPGDINVDVYSVTGMDMVTGITKSKLSYFPPPVAKWLLSSAVDGPAGSRIPTPKGSFLSQSYEAVYHKGVEAGIPTDFSNFPEPQSPNGDYLAHLSQNAKALGIEVEMTLYALENYLFKEGWRPGIDTLAKIATRNEWIRQRFFSKLEESYQEIGLSVFVLKEGAVESGKFPTVVQFFEKKSDLVLLGSEVFTKKKKREVTDRLRGGIWTGPDDECYQFLPSAAVAVLDLTVARIAKSRAKNVGNESRIKALKAEVRELCGSERGSNFVHSSDSTEEAWLYIDTCFENCKEVRASVEAMYESLHLGVMARTKLVILQYIRWMVVETRRFARTTVTKILFGGAQTS